MKADLVTIVGIASSVFTAISLVPQLVKLVKEKKPNGISFLMLGSLFIGLALWVWYGFLKNDWIIVISNSFSLLVNITICIISIKYKREQEATK